MVLTSEVVISSNTVFHSDGSLISHNLATALFNVSMPKMKKCSKIESTISVKQPRFENL